MKKVVQSSTRNNKKLKLQRASRGKSEKRAHLMIFFLDFMSYLVTMQVPFCFNPSQKQQVCGKESKHAQDEVSVSYFFLRKHFSKMRPHQ